MMVTGGGAGMVPTRTSSRIGRDLARATVETQREAVAYGHWGTVLGVGGAPVRHRLSNGEMMSGFRV